MRGSRLVAGLLACLPFTAWADSARPRPEDYVEDPLAPHVTKGSTARLGTAVGFIYGETVDALAVGLVAALGQRFGRFSVEAELAYLDFQVDGPSSQALGDGQRLGLLGRFDVLRLGSNIVGGNSLLSVYVEGGAAVAWNDWYQPAFDEPARTVPADTHRVEGQAGFGIQIDHRLQEPIGFPRRIGWFLGWRVGFSPHDPEPTIACRGSSCRQQQPMSDAPDYTDRSMLFQSSLQVTW